jgi:hypothetical protein
MMRPIGSCTWMRWKSGFVVRGPASEVVEGSVVQVWNRKRAEFTSVRIRSVLNEGTTGMVIGFPEKKSGF